MNMEVRSAPILAVPNRLVRGVPAITIPDRPLRRPDVPHPDDIGIIPYKRKRRHPKRRKKKPYEPHDIFDRKVPKPYNPWKRKPVEKRESAVLTVCIAALCENGESVVVAADHMITAGDIQYEPQQSKIRPITSTVCILTAGTVTTQTAIRYRLLDMIDSSKNLTVREVAELYAECHSREREQRAEYKFLSPLGLNTKTFGEILKTADSELINDIADNLQKFKLSIETIIAGCDSTGAHIYIVRGVNVGNVECCDDGGYISIGIGANHADSQLMFSRHTKRVGWSKTVLQVYRAKKHSEVAPGVGKDMDMLTYRPRHGMGAGKSYITSGAIDKLQSIYLKLQGDEAYAAAEAEKEIETYFNRPK